MPDTSVNFAAPPETLTSDGRLAELAQILVSAVDRANPKKIIEISPHGGDCAFRSIRPVIPTTSGHLNRGIRPLLARRVEA